MADGAPGIAQARIRPYKMPDRFFPYRFFWRVQRPLLPPESTLVSQERSIEPAPQRWLPLYPLAYAAALLPLLTIHLCYLWAASLGHVAWCLPYLHSCTSISAVGRSPPEALLFKALMIPAAVVLALYWWASRLWLLQLGCRSRRRLAAIVALGLIACAGLILYSVVLGEIGDGYRLSRRTGVFAFYGLSYLALLLIAAALHELPMPSASRRAGHALRINAGLMLAMGLLNTAIALWDEALSRRIEDAFEWVFTALLCCQVLITADLWRRTGFRLGVGVDR